MIENVKINGNFYKTLYKNFTKILKTSSTNQLKDLDKPFFIMNCMNSAWIVSVVQKKEHNEKF